MALNRPKPWRKPTLGFVEYLTRVTKMSNRQAEQAVCLAENQQLKMR